MPAFKTRGLMLDPARQMEHQSLYAFLLPWLREWGYNTLHLHLTDDQGCALQFPSYPDLGTPGSYTPDEMRAFVRSARRQGIAVIPEIESLGHTRCITRAKRFRHLCPSQKADGFNALDPEHPDTRRLLTRLFEDTARLFDADVLHAGLDEVDFSVLPRYRNKSRADCWKVFARHAAWVHEAIRRVGKRPAMWGDHILMTPAMAAAFQRDVLIFDWHYDPDFSPASLKYFTGEKFEVWGAPATMCWRARILSNATNLANLREFTAQALNFRRRGLTGMINTVWCPWRYLSGAMDWPIALAGHLFTSDREDPAFGADFGRSFYGLPSGEARRLADLFAALHRQVPQSAFLNLLMTGKGPMAPFTQEHARQCAEWAGAMDRIARDLAPLVGKTRRNGERLRDVLLSVQLLRRMGQWGASERKRKALKPDPGLIRNIHSAWNRTRYCPAEEIRNRPDSGSLDNVVAVANTVERNASAALGFIRQ